MPRVFKRRPFPGFGRSPDFPSTGLGIEWPPLAASPEPDVVHEIITNVVEVPADDPVDTDDVLVERASEFTVHTKSHLGLGVELAQQGQTGTSVAWPAANRAYYMPFVVHEEVTAYDMWLRNGTIVSGNIDLGIYTEAGVRLVSTGSTAQAGVSDIQVVGITDTTFGPGRFYLACAMDNVTGRTHRYSGISTGSGLSGLGIKEEASAFALPATATLANTTSNYVPQMGASLRSTAP